MSRTSRVLTSASGPIHRPGGDDWRLTCESPHEHPLTVATWHQLTGVWVNLEINSVEKGICTGWKLIWSLTSVIFNYLNVSWQATIDLYTCRNAERLTITHDYHSCCLRRNITLIAMTGSWLTGWWILVQKRCPSHRFVAAYQLLLYV